MSALFDQGLLLIIPISSPGDLGRGGGRGGGGGDGCVDSRAGKETDTGKVFGRDFGGGGLAR